MAHRPQHILGGVLLCRFLVRAHASRDFVINRTLHHELLLTGDATLGDDL